VDPERLAPGRFAAWSDRRIRTSALAHYQGIYEMRRTPWQRAAETTAHDRPEHRGSARK
jgi:hypothetical protein